MYATISFALNFVFEFFLIRSIFLGNLSVPEIFCPKPSSLISVKMQNWHSLQCLVSSIFLLSTGNYLLCCKTLDMLDYPKKRIGRFWDAKTNWHPSCCIAATMIFLVFFPAVWNQNRICLINFALLLLVCHRLSHTIQNHISNSVETDFSTK